VQLQKSAALSCQSMSIIQLYTRHKKHCKRTGFSGVSSFWNSATDG